MNIYSARRLIFEEGEMDEVLVQAESATEARKRAVINFVSQGYECKEEDLVIAEIADKKQPQIVCIHGDKLNEEDLDEVQKFIVWLQEKKKCGEE